MVDVNTKYLMLRFIRLIMMVFLAIGSTTATWANQDLPSQHTESQPVQELSQSKGFQEACDKILAGDFVGAGKIVENLGHLKNESINQLARIIQEYRLVEDKRQKSRSKSYQEQIDELEELRLKKQQADNLNGKVDSKKDLDGLAKSELQIDSGTDRFNQKDVNSIDATGPVVKPKVETDSIEFPDNPIELEKLRPEPMLEIMDGTEESEKTEDVDDLSKLFATTIQTLEHASSEQKKVMLQAPLLKQAIEEALQKANQFEMEGKWVDAYAHCYYWLTILYEDNTEYKEHADKLTDLAMIEMSLMDNSCETSLERHEGINSNMLKKALKALDFNYISVIDYAEMTDKGLERCKLLGQVLAKSQKELSFQVSADKIEKWYVGLDIIQSELESPLSTVTMRKFLWAFDEALDLNDTTLQIPKQVVIAQFSKASLGALDPFTSLVWPWEAKEFQKNMTNQFTGIGIRISKIRGVLTAVSLIPNTPAYFSGLDADDAILAINGEPTDDMTMNCAVSKITGPEGTNVTLTIRHAASDETEDDEAKDDKTEDIVITRGRIIVPTIQGWQQTDDGRWRYMVDPVNKIGYVHITGFSETTAPDLDRVLNNLEAKGLRALIIDLRNNTGGYLSTAAAIVDMFIDDGLIVKSQPRWGMSTYEQAHKRGTHPDYPITVLINGESASASEIVSGALQDPKYKRATIVGQRSYGKGSVQTITSFSGDGSQLKYTMAYYHLPSNQRVRNRYVIERQGGKDWGISPDVEVIVKLRTDEGQKMLEVQQANEVLAKADHDQDANPVKRYSLQETIDADPQLAIGLLVVKSKIIQLGGSVEFENPISLSSNSKPNTGG